MESPSDVPAAVGSAPALTCGVEEFARMVGIGKDRARELVTGALRPPGFYVGNQYRVYVAGIDGWLADLSKTGRAAAKI